MSSVRRLRVEHRRSACMGGFCEIAFLFVPTTILYVRLGIPSVWETFLPGSALLGVDTLLGR